MLSLETGEGAAMLAYGKVLDEGIYDVKLETGMDTALTAAESVGGCTVKRVEV